MKLKRVSRDERWVQKNIIDRYIDGRLWKWEFLAAIAYARRSDVAAIKKEEKKIMTRANLNADFVKGCIFGMRESVDTIKRRGKE